MEVICQMIEVIETVENADGSLTIKLEMEQEEVNALLEFAVNTLLKEQLQKYAA